MVREQLATFPHGGLGWVVFGCASEFEEQWSEGCWDHGNHGDISRLGGIGDNGYVEVVPVY